MGGLHVDGFRFWLVRDEPLTESARAARLIPAVKARPMFPAGPDDRPE